MINGRALHFVFKVVDRQAAWVFFTNVLGMKVLRHEEFTEGCGAQCNGPYDNRWSKTMVGYGPEDTHFVFELTYNYGIKSYELGNDFLGAVVRSKKALENAKTYSWPIYEANGMDYIDLEGQRFYLVDDEQPVDKDPVEEIILGTSNLKESVDYWNRILDMKVLQLEPKVATLAYDENQTKLALRDVGEKIDHKTGYGRIAFSVPTAQLPGIQTIIKKNKKKVLTDLVTLDTPGKASVTVIILADPDGHEICFVGDEAFRELSKPDPEAEVLLNRYIEKYERVIEAAEDE